MDARQFDSIVKGMAQTRISRLAAVRVLAGVLAGVLAACVTEPCASAGSCA